MKLCIFDLDGTLADTLSTIAHYGNTALAACGLPEIATEDYKTLVGDGRSVLIHRMLACFDSDGEETFKKACEVYDRAYEADVIFDTKPYDGIISAVQSLREKGVKTALLSNKPDNVVKMVCKKLFFDGLFDEIRGQREDTPKKPAPDGALILAQKLGIDKSDCVFVGDTNVDIFTGKNATMVTAGVLWGFRSREELEAAGADVILEKPSDIINLADFVK